MAIKFLNTVQVNTDVLYVDAANDRVGIGTPTPGGALDVVGAYIATLFRVSNTQADATTKYGSFMGRHYTNSEENITGMLLTSSSNASRGGTISIGGGITSANAVNEIKFYTAANNTTLLGSERMRITNAGNVGIGTTSPSQIFEVNTTAYRVGKFTGNTDDGTGYVGAVVEIESNNDARGRGVYLTHRLSTDTTDSEWYAGVPYTGDGYSIGNAAYGTSINSDTGPAHKDQSKLFILENGNVGIGTTSPDSNLEIESSTGGVLRLTSSDTTVLTGESIGKIEFKSNDASTGGNNVMGFIDSVATNAGTRYALSFGTGDAAAAVERMRIDNLGAVRFNDYGAGTLVTDASGNITVSSGGGAGGPYLPLSGGSSVGQAMTGTLHGPGATFYVSGNNSSNLKVGDGFFRMEMGRSSIQARVVGVSGAASSLNLNPNGGDVLFPGSGNVGIGTTSPIAKLHLVSDDTTASAIKTLVLGGGTSTNGNGQYIQFSSSSNDALGSQIAGTRVGTGASSDLRFSTTSGTSVVTERMRINSDGTVGIGTNALDTAGGDKLHVDGTLRVGPYFSVNDRDFIKLIPNGCDTKIYSPNERFHIENPDGDIIITPSSSGGVGIGTTSPSSKLQVTGGIQMADDTATASAAKVGTLKYRVSGNNSYVDMCMQTGATTYAWINIVQNNW